jgi:hypothetical protein
MAELLYTQYRGQVVALERAGVSLSGHLKTGQMWSLQNRPTEQNQDKSSYTLSGVVPANLFVG